MGLDLAIFEFAGSVPDLSQIVNKAAEIGGLPIIASPRSLMPAQDSEDVWATLAFECLPKDRIEIEIHRVIHDVSNSINTARESTPQAVGAARSDEWRVKLTGYMGQEPTLMHVLALALESLGGNDKWEYIADSVKPKQQPKIRLPISARVLRWRHRKVQFMGILVMILLVILSPVLLVLGAFGIAKELIRVRKESREFMRRYSDHFEAYNQKG